MAAAGGRLRRFALLLLALLGLGAWWLYTPDAARAVLEARHAAPPSQFAEVAGLRLHLRDTGPRDAPAVIFLHGFASSLHTWEEVALGLAEFRVIRFDLPGFGLTGADPTGDYTDARAHAVILALMARLGLERAALVGSSMGGRIAWSFAAAHPARVSRLVLMAPDGFASPGVGYEQPPRVPLLLRALPWTLPEAMLRGSLTPTYGDASVLTEALFQRYRDMMLAPGVRQAILDRVGQHVLPRPEPLLARISPPVLLLWGDQDRLVPVTNARDYLRALPDARLTVLPGIGHVPMEEVPAEVVRLLRDFFTGM